MGRPRTASNILEARGRFAHDPQRRRPNEPKPKGKFPKKAPAHLAPDEIECWKQLAKTVPAGVLTAADILAVEVTAVLLAEFRRSGAEMSAAHLTRMTTLMGRLGLDPSGRASLVVETPKTNKFDQV